MVESSPRSAERSQKFRVGLSGGRSFAGSGDFLPEKIERGREAAVSQRAGDRQCFGHALSRDEARHDWKGQRGLAYEAFHPRLASDGQNQ
jgi:hypothetical protein